MPVPKFGEVQLCWIYGPGILKQDRSCTYHRSPSILKRDHSPQRGLIFVSVTVWYSVSVKTTEILAALDAEIARLQEARNALAGLSGAKRRGRPSASALPNKTNRKKRTLSTEAREKIAAAQRKRWAKQKSSA
jgi:hypothetical protein